MHVKVDFGAGMAVGKAHLLDDIIGGPGCTLTLELIAATCSSKTRRHAACNFGSGHVLRAMQYLHYLRTETHVCTECIEHHTPLP